MRKVVFVVFRKDQDVTEVHQRLLTFPDDNTTFIARWDVADAFSIQMAFAQTGRVRGDS